MSNDALMIASAILNLQQELSNFKDYIFPLLTTSDSVLLGYLVANNVFAKQGIIKSEIERVNNFNEFLVVIDSGMQTAGSSKKNYKDRINTNPIERAFSIPTISCYFSPPK